jgi:hypothetical protein
MLSLRQDFSFGGGGEEEDKEKKTRGVSHFGPAIYIKKDLKAKEEFFGNSNISPCKNIIFKNSSKKTQNISKYYNSLTNLKFQHKPKYHLKKSSYKIRPIIIT